MKGAYQRAQTLLAPLEALTSSCQQNSQVLRRKHCFSEDIYMSID